VKHHETSFFESVDGNELYSKRSAADHASPALGPMVLSTGKQQSMTTNTATERDVDYKTIAAKKFVNQDS
jgi:hypothetical protein